MDQGQDRPCSPTSEVLTQQCECGGSDTESLAQERASQQQLYMRVLHHGQIKHVLPPTKNVDRLEQGGEEDADANDDDTEDLQVYDSLEVASNPHTKRNPNLPEIQYLDIQIDKREGRPPLCDDAYSDLRYDPNWRTNLKGNGRFYESPQISVEEHYQVPEDRSCGDRQALEIKGTYRYIVDRCPTVIVTPHIDGNDFDQPYHLHQQDGHTSSVIFPHNHTLQCRSPETDLPMPVRISMNNQSHKTLQTVSKYENSCDSPGENITRAPEETEDRRAIEIQTYDQQELRYTQGGPIQKMGTSASSSPKVLSYKKAERLMENIVERNKVTLGRITSKCDSYVKVHVLKQDIPYSVDEEHKTVKVKASAENRERWLQKTQQLQVAQIREGKKSEWKEKPNPSGPQRPPALVQHCSSFPSVRPAAVTQPKNQQTSQPLTPTIHLNVSLNTSPHLLSLLEQEECQNAIVNLASLHGRPHWSPAFEAQLALPSSYQQTTRNQQNHHNLESSSEQWQRTTALQSPSSFEGEDQTLSSKQVHTKQCPQNVPETPSTSSSQSLSSYTVLPPIRKPVTRKQSKLSPGQTVNTAYPIHGSSLDSYLVQMQKQKQLKERVSYKMKTDDITHQGLSPDYTSIEKTKMKRQKLYSDVIREQNKKIRRIPFLPAKELEDSDKKVPRIKALEYAKSIVKPPVQSQPKQRKEYRPEGITEDAPHLQVLDVSQLSRLDLLTKRHEEEKQAVACFRKAHAV